MNLVTVDPIDAVLDRLMTARASSPAADWIMDATAYYLTLDVPGIAHDALSIETADQHLRIAGQRTGSLPEGQTRLRQERPIGAWTTTWQLPRDANPNAITATLEAGVLTLTIPKREDAKPRAIPIQPHAE